MSGCPCNESPQSCIPTLRYRFCISSFRGISLPGFFKKKGSRDRAATAPGTTDTASTAWYTNNGKQFYDAKRCFPVTLLPCTLLVVSLRREVCKPNNVV